MGWRWNLDLPGRVRRRVCSDWQPATQQGIQPFMEGFAFASSLPGLPWRSARSWCFAVGGGEAWANCCCLALWTPLLPEGAGPPRQPHPKRAGTGRQGHSCSSLKPCASLEVWYLPLPLRPHFWGGILGSSLELYRLETQRVFSFSLNKDNTGLF